MNTDNLHVYGSTFMAARFANMYEKTSVLQEVTQQDYPQSKMGTSCP